MKGALFPMKKLLTLFFCAVLVLGTAVPALADVIWEPMDGFYMAHADECEYLDGSYEAREDAPLRESPDKSAGTNAVPAGETVHISYGWQGWGYVESTWGDGWVELTRFRRLYGPGDFLARHGEEIVPGEGTISRAENESICFWTYPGSGVIADRMDSAAYDWADSDPAYTALWTDGEGRRWGRVGYYYGIRDGWVCLDDPGAEDLPREGPVYADETGEAGDPAPEEASPAAPENPPAGTNLSLWAVGLIVLAVTVTAALMIGMLLGKKKPGA